MNDLVFVDSTFDKNKSKEYKLSIRVSSGGFSFSILDENKQCLALARFKAFNENSVAESLNSFKELIRNNELLNLTYHSVSILWVSNESILIPNEFFTEEFAFESYQLCHSLNSTQELQWNEMKHFNSKNVFAIPLDFKDLLTQHFSELQFFHHSTPFYNSAVQEEISDTHPNVFVNIQKEYFHMIIPDRNGKHFINSFHYQEDADLVYYILNVYKQQKLNNERSKLIVDGLVQDESKSIQLLKKYLAKVDVRLLPSKLRIKNEIPHKEYNQFINLLNLSECE
ncbi:DUF3822 family protein [Marinifilum caeruleilacunae]|uniref:DUF3822 family protein n=1 Tax=Marinifilum caeruleilacunae TaxID=2499076 RepID=A0ABX1WWQ2_9BACT|nr:DUF3822 family protein [Marinifilum caeruleilacunae]NOU60323.1 DUF3822 family protein [Marinifilum caeruleilacunae]